MTSCGRRFPAREMKRVPHGRGGGSQAFPSVVEGGSTCRRKAISVTAWRSAKSACRESHGKGKGPPLPMRERALSQKTGLWCGDLLGVVTALQVVAQDDGQQVHAQHQQDED